MATVGLGGQGSQATPVTRGNLEAARIYVVHQENPYAEKQGDLAISCMFNPYEYTVSKTNTFAERSKNEGDRPQAELSKAGAQTLRLSLTFDTYETGADVSLETAKLWKFMDAKAQGKDSKTKKGQPPMVAFHWGVFRFVSYITSMTQRFTLFKRDGTPVRAKVDVTFTQYEDIKDYPGQNPTSGGGSTERTWRVVAGDRLDTIAAEVYGDATEWRRIAAYNRLADPLDLRCGQELRIPLD